MPAHAAIKDELTKLLGEPTGRASWRFMAQADTQKEEADDLATITRPAPAEC